MPRLTRRDFLRLSALSALASPLLLNSGLSKGAAPTPTPTATLLPPPAKPIRGLFAILPRNEDAIPAEVLASPYIAGITVQISWSTLQPTPKDYAWDVLDGAISRAAAAGKKVALRPLAGVGSPAWLYKTAGVKKFTFTPESDLYHPLEFGKEISLPYPWDKALIGAWSAFVQALGQRFDPDPTLVRVAVSGPMYQQAETYLPHDEAVLTDWAKNGYFLNVIQAVWQKMLDVYAQAFPRTPFTLDLNPMPDAIDRKGATFSGLVPVAIAQYGLRRYPGRFFPAQSDLSDVYPWLPAPLPGPAKQPALYLSYEKQTIPIYQLLTTAAQTFGVLISESRVSRTANRIRAALERAVQLKATYIEIPAVWVSDPANADALRGLFETRAG